jgi:Flp pilus assembly protein TadD
MYDLGRPREAIRDADEALKLNPDQASAYALRAMANRQLGLEEDVNADSRKALELGFDGPLMNHLLRVARKGFSLLPMAGQGPGPGA